MMRIQQCSRPTNVMFSGGSSSDVAYSIPVAPKHPEPGPDHAKASSAKETRWAGYIPLLLATLFGYGR